MILYGIMLNIFYYTTIDIFLEICNIFIIQAFIYLIISLFFLFNKTAM